MISKFTGTRIYENGTREEEEFFSYWALIGWLAADSTAGIMATKDGEDIDQLRLCADVEEQQTF